MTKADVQNMVVKCRGVKWRWNICMEAGWWSH